MEQSKLLFLAWISLCRILVMNFTVQSLLNEHIPTYPWSKQQLCAKWMHEKHTHTHTQRTLGSSIGIKYNIRYSSITVYTQEWLKTQWSYSKTNECHSFHPQCYACATYIYIILLRQLNIFLYYRKWIKYLQQTL
jgi:hypothetical protein